MNSIGLDAARDLLVGAVDVYVHATPDVLPRRNDDLALARELKGAGFATAIHRHHFSATVERARLASDATGFPLRGAILLNDSAGGLSPRAVDVSLRMGGRWVGMPTLSARAYRPRLERLPAERRRVIGVGAGDISAVDEGGAVVPAVEEILALASAAGAVVNLGYLSHAECLAVQRAGRRHGDLRFVATNPKSTMDLSDAQIDALLVTTGTFLEMTAYSMFPGRVGGAEVTCAQAVNLFRRVGVERCILSSDSGSAGSPPTVDLLAAVVVALAAEGLTNDELVALLRRNPASLIDAAIN